MKKMNNKGFSLVELIIVIAIMAILAGAIAPALIRYIDKSRKSNDVSACKTIKTAVETAMANEKTYELLTATASGSTEGATIIITEDQDATASGSVTINGNTTSAYQSSAEKEIGANIGEKTPKVKYRKKGANTFIVKITSAGTVNVYITKGSSANITAGTASDNSTYWQVCPDICDEYQ